jgi:hypothetical protein
MKGGGRAAVSCSYKMPHPHTKLTEFALDGPTPLCRKRFPRIKLLFANSAGAAIR